MMERLDANTILRDELDKEYKCQMVLEMVSKQIEAIERLMSSTTLLVKNPTAYNHCATLLDQLKTYSSSAYLTNCPPLAQLKPEGYQINSFGEV